MFTNKKETKREKKTESTEKEKEMRLIWLETTRGANRMKKKGIRLFVCVCLLFLVLAYWFNQQEHPKKEKKESSNMFACAFLD